MPLPRPGGRPHVHADRRPFLLARNRIQAALRGLFADRDFVEVDTAALQVSPGNEAHLHAFATEAIGPDGVARAALPPHLAGIRLQEAAGRGRDADRSAFAHVYRNRERGPLHHPEFTMLEWYRAGEPYEALMDDCADDPGARGRDGRRRDASPSAAARPIRSPSRSG